MARHKDYCYEQGKMIPISFRKRILPGTFEYALEINEVRALEKAPRRSPAW